MISTKLKAVLAIASLFGASMAAQAAGSVNAAFTVNATLTSTCIVASGSASSYTFSYTGVTNAAISNADAGTITFTCTRGLTPTVVWDTTNGATTAQGASADATGVAAGVAYTLKTGTATKTAGSAATSTVGAGADSHAFALKLDVAAGQAGDVTSGVSTASARTLTLSY